jgi:CHAT domain-containing protein
VWYWRFSTLKAEILVRRGFAQESLALLKADLPSSLASSDLAVWRKLTQGMACADLQRFAEAGRNLQDAEALARDHHPELLGEVSLRAGTLASVQGDSKTALSKYHETLQIARAQKDPFLEVAALGSLGLESTQQEHYDQSIDWNDEALRLSRSAGAKDSESYILGNLGWSYLEIGDYDKALNLLEQAEVTSGAVGSVGAQIDWLIEMANVSYYLHDYAAAVKTAQKALELARTLDLKLEIRLCLNTLSTVALKRGELELASKYNDEALALSQANKDRPGELSSTLIQGRIEAGEHHSHEAERLLETVIQDPATDTPLRWQAEARLAGVYADTGLPTNAEQQYRQSIRTIETARSSIKDEELRVSFLSNSIEFYEDYIAFLIAHHRNEDALQVAELSRARTLMEGLGMSPTTLSFPMRQFAPQALARRLNATLLFYWIGEERSYLWVVTPAALSVFSLPKQEEINRLEKAYQKAILDGHDVLSSQDSATGQQLYNVLVAPARKFIVPNSRVILLPGEGLYDLNFETLIVPEPHPHYWIEDVELSTANSLAMSSAAHPDVSGEEKKLLLIGNPEPPNADFPALPQAAAEMQKVSTHFPEAQRKVLEGKQATASLYFRSAPERFAYLHFATHGIASHTRPLESAVILSPEGDGYKLYARDIVAHPLKAQLVTISACNGAGTRAYVGEGLVGLSWAFLRAGARNVIAALWEVSDASSTAQLMDALYSDLARGVDPATALRNAKLFILKSNSNTVFRKPFYWAPFQLYAGS